VVAGIGIVAACWRLRRIGVGTARCLEYAFSWTMCYLMLLGPATEKSTYALLGPSLAWPLLAARRERRCGALPFWGLANLLLWSGFLERTSRTGQAEHPWLRCLLPLAAILAAAGLAWRAIDDHRRRREDGLAAAGR
jgi:hypothetical protein